jgi:hypothetical protein
MKAPRKVKKRKTGRPLENVPLRRLVSDVKREMAEKLRPAFSNHDKSQSD